MTHTIKCSRGDLFCVFFFLFSVVVPFNFIISKNRVHNGLAQNGTVMSSSALHFPRVKSISKSSYTTH